jgi:gluconate 2-dehydrogenase gamma chain
MAVTIDKRSAGASGTGERPYRSGPCRLATPGRGYPLPFAPAEAFDTSLAALEDQDIAAVAAPFEQANLSAQAATK